MLISSACETSMRSASSFMSARLRSVSPAVDHLDRLGVMADHPLHEADIGWREHHAGKIRGVRHIDWPRRLTRGAGLNERRRGAGGGRSDGRGPTGQGCDDEDERGNRRAAECHYRPQSS